ncbi:hypothetical protein [Pseudomonas xantholysinigenes]|uniref:Uncharacterized protein n=1 Tax=Pseudomonas xantholysinigenes TaxID=2745490 RepID=A0A9E6TZG1_9PSED|nr:hypothetical protein [Pseudomonas xantholysinigenes]QXI40417.1 hypothetical protein HU772_010235 [Pseudomonas xantholysinigenes]
MGAARKLNVVSIQDKPAKVRVNLRAKPHRKIDMHQLPFVGRDHAQEESGGYCFWDVPFAGGFRGGLETGQAIAGMYLAHLRRVRHEKSYKLELGALIMGMMNRSPRNEEEHNSRKGQLMGFAGALDSWLRAAVDEFGEKLDTIDHEDLLAQANGGLDTKAADERFSRLLAKAGF